MNDDQAGKVTGGTVRRQRRVAPLRHPTRQVRQAAASDERLDHVEGRAVECQHEHRAKRARFGRGGRRRGGGRGGHSALSVLCAGCVLHGMRRIGRLRRDETRAAAPLRDRGSVAAGSPWVARNPSQGRGLRTGRTILPLGAKPRPGASDEAVGRRHRAPPLLYCAALGAAPKRRTPKQSQNPLARDERTCVPIRSPEIHPCPSRSCAASSA